MGTLGKAISRRGTLREIRVCQRSWNCSEVLDMNCFMLRLHNCHLKWLIHICRLTSLRFRSVLLYS
ncbi:unnamed protein product [Brassica rapa subsp. trilocularis]